MLQPPERIVAFDGPTPTPSWDIGRQFDEHARALARVIDFLRLVVRDDGKLRNGTVGPEQLDPQLSEEMARRIYAEAENMLSAALAASRDARSALGEVKDALALIEDRHREIATMASLTREQARQIEAQTQTALTALQEARDAALPAPRDATGLLVTVGATSATGPNGPYTGMGGFYGADTLGAAYTAQDYAQVAIEWAEHMPDTIPGNVLTVSNITGSHWSARWWANQCASAFGMLAWWYQGAFPSPGPPTTPYTPTGQLIPTGAMYYNTTTNTMMVWSGSTWMAAYQPAKGVTASLFYTATANQTVFPLSVTDLQGHTFAFNATTPEGLQAYVNGVRLEPTFDYTVNFTTSTITFVRPLTLNSAVIFDILTPAAQLTPSGTVNTVLLTQIVPNGSTTVFSLTVASNGHPTSVAKNEELLVSVDGIIQQPGTQYSASGATLTFTEAPGADSKVFIVWWGPPNP